MMLKMSTKVTIRIERRLFDEAREAFPELKEVSDADVARIVFRRFLGEKR